MNMKRPAFPQSKHSRFILAMLLAEMTCHQYSYHYKSGYPIADFRKRLSDVRKAGWVTDKSTRQQVKDKDGVIRVCDLHWIDNDWLLGLFALYPDMQKRCALLIEKELSAKANPLSEMDFLANEA